MVMKAEKGLNDFLKGDSKAASIANAFKETLTKEFAGEERSGNTLLFPLNTCQCRIRPRKSE